MMFSLGNAFHVSISKLLATLYSVLSVLGGGIFYHDTLPQAPADFTPVVRFAVCSDVHINGDPNQTEAVRFGKLIRFMNDYSDAQEYKGFDALCVCGDFTNSGAAEEYDVFNSVIAENLREGTQLLTCMGNHEFISTRDKDPRLACRLYEEKMGGSLNTSVKINGYHFILCSYDETGSTFIGRTPWLEKQLFSAVKDTGDKPVFVFQHPAPFGTIYGSVNWGDASIPAVLGKYPQAVDFSGHSHYPVNDPRSIWQGGYTALGCGTLSYFETELDGIDGQFPYSYKEAAQFYIVEADAEGNVRVMPYDLITDSFFDNAYYLTELACRNYEYSYLKMKQRDPAPAFPADTQISTELSANGDTILRFTGAKDRFVVESYKLSVTKNGITVADDNFSGKYMYLFEDDSYTVNLGKLQSGKTYCVSITAMNAFAELSKPLTYSFTAK